MSHHPRGASKVEGVSAHQGSCHIIKASNGAPMASKPIIIKQTLVHDVTIKEFNVQGGKVIVQGGIIMHHLLSSVQA
jgi:hypothetical protein